ncbi:glycosyltransferase [Brevibacterium album]|uniref:glycosyltransferase n=1 Tax=Brevibacterium album TaxID=417948 RepID=UPI000422D719|nr:glycosyltransferase [Brevibacterium album]
MSAVKTPGTDAASAAPGTARGIRLAEGVSVLVRQCSSLLRIVADHVADDPVQFGMQVSRRLPARVSRTAGAVLARVPARPARAAAAWLTGDPAAARDLVSARTARGLEARLLGELALSMGLRESARALASASAGTRGGLRLAARIAWHSGEMGEAVALAPEGAMRMRLASERRTFQPGWWPAAWSVRAAPAPARAPHADVLFALTNSLPHTQSGYTLRSHAVLTAVRDAGVRVLAADRTGYPTAVGKLTSRDRSFVDGIEYLYDLPARMGRSPEARLEQQAQFLRTAAQVSGARVIHTTTHFTNGLAAGAAARALGLPWVYEVRGSLEDTWASGRGDAAAVAQARESERYRLFRAREAEVACEADAVVTLGETMAAELASRGVDRSRILVAPNSVGADVLEADWQRPAADVREELGLPSGGVWVGTAASVVGYEGLDVLVDAVAEARVAGTDLRLLVVGGGVELPTLRQRARSLGEAAVLTGRLPAVQARRHVQALDIVAVPRRDVEVSRKITPLKPAEAGGLGRAVVLSDLPALAEALPPGARRLVPAESVRALAAELAALAADPEERARLGASARGFVEEHRTWEKLGERYARMYEDMGVDVRGGAV